MFHENGIPRSLQENEDEEQPPGTSLRSLLENDYEQRTFKHMGVADVIVKEEPLDKNIAAMYRGLLAHSALNLIFAAHGRPGHENLGQAIDAAYVMRVITPAESKLLKNFNKAANDAKHALGSVFQAVPGAHPENKEAKGVSSSPRSLHIAPPASVQGSGDPSP